MLLLLLRWTLISGVGGFWSDSVFWVPLVLVISGIGNNFDYPPIIADTPPDCIANCWIFFFWWANIFHLVSDGIEMLLWELQWKLKAKQVLPNASIFFSWINNAIKSGNVILDGLSCRIYDASFITLPEALRNTEIERLYTPEELFITIIIFSESWNALYVFIGISFSTSIIKSDTLWPPLRELTEETSR